MKKSGLLFGVVLCFAVSLFFMNFVNAGWNPNPPICGDGQISTPNIDHVDEQCDLGGSIPWDDFFNAGCGKPETNDACLCLGHVKSSDFPQCNCVDGATRDVVNSCICDHANHRSYFSSSNICICDPLSNSTDGGNYCSCVDHAFNNVTSGNCQCDDAGHWVPNAVNTSCVCKQDYHEDGGICCLDGEDNVDGVCTGHCTDRPGSVSNHESGPCPCDTANGYIDDGNGNCVKPKDPEVDVMLDPQYKALVKAKTGQTIDAITPVDDIDVQFKYYSSASNVNTVTSLPTVDIVNLDGSTIVSGLTMNPAETSSDGKIQTFKYKLLGYQEDDNGWSGTTNKDVIKDALAIGKAKAIVHYSDSVGSQTKSDDFSVSPTGYELNTPSISCALPPNEYVDPSTEPDIVSSDTKRVILSASPIGGIIATPFINDFYRRRYEFIGPWNQWLETRDKGLVTFLQKTPGALYEQLATGLDVSKLLNKDSSIVTKTIFWILAIPGGAFKGAAKGFQCAAVAGEDMCRLGTAGKAFESTGDSVAVLANRYSTEAKVAEEAMSGEKVVGTILRDSSEDLTAINDVNFNTWQKVNDPESGANINVFYYTAPKGNYLSNSAGSYWNRNFKIGWSDESLAIDNAIRAKYNLKIDEPYMLIKSNSAKLSTQDYITLYHEFQHAMGAGEAQAFSLSTIDAFKGKPLIFYTLNPQGKVTSYQYLNPSAWESLYRGIYATYFNCGTSVGGPIAYGIRYKSLLGFYQNPLTGQLSGKELAVGIPAGIAGVYMVGKTVQGEYYILELFLGPPSGVSPDW